MDLQTVASDPCKYCGELSTNVTMESLICMICNQLVHSHCLQRGTIPGNLRGDVFYRYKCAECSIHNTEEFLRERMSWLQVLSLSLYHLMANSKQFARKGYFHWKLHIAAFIDRNWDILFRSDVKRKPKWIGTISGTLSHYSPIFFTSGTSVLNEQGWWTLTFPNLSPNIVIEINEELMAEKQICKEAKMEFNGSEKLIEILNSKSYITEALLKQNDTLTNPCDGTICDINDFSENGSGSPKQLVGFRRKIRTNLNKGATLLPTVDNILHKNKRKLILDIDNDITSFSNVFKKANTGPFPFIQKNKTKEAIIPPEEQHPKYLDFLCHYNTKDIGEPSLTQIRLTGGVQEDFILSPYSSICLSPYIWRLDTLNPPWLQLMDELKSKVNNDSKDWKLPARATLDFTYVQPNHIPAINSLCNQFFWNGINLTDILQYPEYTCIVLYKKLVVGFACVVPNVKLDEVYLSFLFTRPSWRKCGIAKFMIYHLIQISSGKNITLHVGTSNPALVLFQKYGFKISQVVKNFYGAYLPADSKEPRNAFFCKLNCG